MKILTVNQIWFELKKKKKRSALKYCNLGITYFLSLSILVSKLLLNADLHEFKLILNLLLVSGQGLVLGVLAQLRYPYWNTASKKKTSAHFE